MRLKLLAALPALFAVPAVFAQTAGGEFTVCEWIGHCML